MAYEKLLELAEKLESVSPDKFDYETWVNVDAKELPMADPASLPGLIANKSCGTTGCAIGWCTVFWPDDWKFNLSELPVLAHAETTAERYDSFIAAAKFFGINSQESTELFCPDGEKEELFTPHQVAEKIRNFVASKSLAN